MDLFLVIITLTGVGGGPVKFGGHLVDSPF